MGKLWAREGDILTRDGEDGFGGYGHPCKVLRCDSEASAVFTIRSDVRVIESVVCAHHYDELVAGAGYEYDWKQHRILVGSDTVPPIIKADYMQNDFEEGLAITIEYGHSSEDSKFATFRILEEHSAGLEQILKLLAPPIEPSST